MVDFVNRDRDKLIPVSNARYFQSTTGKHPFKKWPMKYPIPRITTVADIAHRVIKVAENDTCYCQHCNRQSHGYKYGNSDPTFGLNAVHDATLGSDDESVIICYD